VWSKRSNKHSEKEGDLTTASEFPIIISELKGKNVRALCCGEEFTVIITGLSNHKETEK
jgi:hypothetical protein